VGLQEGADGRKFQTRLRYPFGHAQQSQGQRLVPSSLANWFKLRTEEETLNCETKGKLN